MSVAPAITERLSANSVASFSAALFLSIYALSFAAILSKSGLLPVIASNLLLNAPNHIGLITNLSGVDIKPSATNSTPFNHLCPDLFHILPRKLATVPFALPPFTPVAWLSIFTSTNLPDKSSLGNTLFTCLLPRFSIAAGALGEPIIPLSFVPAINPLGSTIKAKLMLDVSSAINLPVPASIER